MPEWHWSNPSPSGINLIDMSFHNGLYVQVGEHGQVLTGTNMQTLLPRQIQTSNALRSTVFFGDRLIISGESGTILYSDDGVSFNLVNLGTTDWLEGTAASSSLIVAVGDNGSIYSSPNGVDWQRRAVSFADWLRSVDFGGPAGSQLFVAVGESGTVATSANGVTWQKRSAFTTQDLNRVSWTGSQFWALGTGGAAFTSANGLNWSAVATGATNTLNAVAVVGSYRVVAGDGELRLNEGTGWVDQLGADVQVAAPNWTYLSAIWDGSSFWLGGRTGLLVEGLRTNVSTSPIFWLPSNDSPRNWLWDVKRMPQLYLAVGDEGTILSSVGGVDWSQELPPDSATNSVLLGIGGRTNLAVAVGSSGTIIYSLESWTNVVSTNLNGVVTTNRASTLGINWSSPPNAPTAEDLQGVAAAGNLLVVSGGNGLILTSTNAVTWTKRATPVQSFLSSVESFPGGWVATGASGTILFSADGTNWARRTTSSTNWLYRARNLNGKLIVVGQNGTILTSSDGLQWAAQNSGTTRWLNDVQYVGGRYYAVGTQGTILSSPDAVVWSPEDTLTGKSLYAAAVNDGQLVVVGIEGVILRSQRVPLTTPVGIVDYPKSAAASDFVFLGAADQRFTLDRSTNLVDWSAGPVLEIYEGAGTLFHTDTATNSTARQFFRTTLAQ